MAENVPADHYFVNNPQELLSTPTPDLLVDLENQGILEMHLQCAAHEMPLSVRDEAYFGPAMKEICEKQLLKDSDDWWAGNAFLVFALIFIL